MRKIYQIDAIRVYEQTGVFAQLDRRTRIRRPDRPRTHWNEAWIHAVFTPAQLNFIQNRTVIFRSHPRHSPTIEVFVDELELSERDYTLIGLLF